MARGPILGLSRLDLWAPGGSSDSEASDEEDEEGSLAAEEAGDGAPLETRGVGKGRSALRSEAADAMAGQRGGRFEGSTASQYRVEQVEYRPIDVLGAIMAQSSEQCSCVFGGRLMIWMMWQAIA